MERSAPLWTYLFQLAAWATPAFIIGWTLYKWRTRNAWRLLRAALVGLGAWLAAVIGFLVLAFLFAPCLENCQRFFTPEINAVHLALTLGYTVVVWRIAMYVYRASNRGQSPNCAD